MRFFYDTFYSYVHFSQFLHYNSRVVLLLYYNYICIKSFLLEWYNHFLTI